MGRHVLIIDDDRLILEKVRQALEAKGIQVTTSLEPGVPDGVDAASVNLVLIDVNMPGYFGDDLVEVLPDLGIRAPVYLYSSIDERDLAQRARRARATGYISKRLSYSQVADEVEAILGARR